MDDFKIEGAELQKIIIEVMPKLLKEKLTEGYSNPLKTAIEEELKEKDGEIRKLVKDTLTSILIDDAFKNKLTQEIVSLIIKKGLEK